MTGSKEKPRDPEPDGEFFSSFTLIELLMVIAIIATIASMLLPSLKRARDTANRISCGNKERQISLAIMNYADTYKSWYPPTQGTSSQPSVSGNDPRPWILRLTLEGFLKHVYHPRSPASGEGNKIFWCSFAMAQKPDIGFPIVNDASYGFNLSLANTVRAVQATEVKRPSRIVLLAETYRSQTGEQDMGNNIARDGRLAYRHGGVVPWIFCDGHMETKNSARYNLTKNPTGSLNYYDYRYYAPFCHNPSQESYYRE